MLTILTLILVLVFFEELAALAFVAAMVGIPVGIFGMIFFLIMRVL